MKKMTMKQYEKSPADKKADAKMMKPVNKKVGMTNQATSKKKK